MVTDDDGAYEDDGAGDDDGNQGRCDDGNIGENELMMVVMVVMMIEITSSCRQLHIGTARKESLKKITMLH